MKISACGHPNGVRQVQILLAGVVVFWCFSAQSHEVRPGFLQFTTGGDGYYDVLWKRPVRENRAIRLDPQVSGGMLAGEPNRIESAPGYEIRVWRDLPLGRQGMRGRTITVHGLDQSITDVFVSVQLANGDTVNYILRPGSSTFTVDDSGGPLTVPAYLQQGVVHILTGIDHLFFLLCLVLLVYSRKALIFTITSFTLGHSLTLTATTLGLVIVQSALIEALVALSIVVVAVEVAHKYRGKYGLTLKFPWLMALAFGLLHGFAFAGALTEIGLPEGAVPLALLLFNIGVEIGQLLFVAVVFVVMGLASRIWDSGAYWIRWTVPYSVGSFGVVWCLERMTLLWI